MKAPTKLTPETMDEYGISKIFEHRPEILNFGIPKIGLIEYICKTHLGTLFCVDPDGYIHPESGKCMREFCRNLCITKKEYLPVGNVLQLTEGGFLAHIVDAAFC